MTPEATGETRTRPGFRGWYALAVVVIATLFGVVDRQILVLIVDPIKKGLSLSDYDIGSLHGIGPAVFAMLAAFPLGWLADRTERRTVLAVCIIAWSLATALCGFAQDFTGLFAASIGIAVGEAVLGPITYSLIPDLFPGRSRLTANFVYFAAGTVGAGVAMMFAGGAMSFVDSHRSALPWGLDSWDVWRIIFIVVALPGPLVALAVALIGPVKRTVVAAVEGAPPPPGGLFAYLREHGLVVGSVFMAFGLYGLSLGGVSNWVPVIATRVLKIPADQVGVNLGAAGTAGAISGIVIAGLCSGLLLRLAGPAAPLRAMQWAMAIAAALCASLLFVTEPMHLYVLNGVMVAALTGGLALSPTMLQDVSAPNLRGRVIAIAGLFFTVPAAIGPMLIGSLSDMFPAQNGLTWAVVIASVPAGVASAILFNLMEKPFVRTYRILNGVTQTP